MRISEAGLALITRTSPRGEPEYLTQWHKKWQAYSLIGGHLQPGESFRNCCIREVEEELGLQRDRDFQTASDPMGPTCEFTAFSKSAGAETRYRFELFATEILTSRAIASVNANADNRWLSVPEIHQQRTSDGTDIAEQVTMLLKSHHLLGE